MKKTFTSLLIVIITIALIYALVRYMPLQGFAFAFSLNFLLMACILFFTESLKSQFNAAYFNQKNWEQNGKIYQSLGVNIYRQLLVWIGWEKLNKKAKPVDKNINTLKQLHYRTKQDELAHLIIFIIVLGFNVFVAIRFGVLKSCWLLVLNILLNLYPVLLQRYNRPRIARAIKLNRQRELV